MFHYREGEQHGYTAPEERLCEVDTHHVEKMLARIHELDERPLTEERPLEKRLIGCCRDCATLLYAMARYRGIPTRTRIGFSAYFDSHYRFNHAIAEYWETTEQRWRLVDPQMSAGHVKENGLHFDVLDVPRDEFLVGGKAWQMYRSGAIDPDTFCVTPDSDVKGEWFIRHKLIQDVATQHKMEMLLWDCWGLMLKEELSEEDGLLLDRAAVLTQAGNEAFAELQALYEENLKVTPPIMTFSPVAPPSEFVLMQGHAELRPISVKPV